MPIIILTLTLAASSPAHGSICAAYAAPATPRRRAEDAALVTGASGHATSPSAVEAALATSGWRVLWATPDDSEPGVFVFRGPEGRERFVDVWGGPTSDRAGASRWARKIGTPTGLARCFAERLVRAGP